LSIFFIRNQKGNHDTHGTDLFSEQQQQQR